MHRVYRAGNDLRRSRLAAFDLSKDTRNLRCIGLRGPGETSDRRLYSHTHLATRARLPAALLRSRGVRGEKEEEDRAREADLTQCLQSQTLTGPFSWPHAINSEDTATRCRAGKRRTNRFAILLSVIPVECTSASRFHAFSCCARDDSSLWATSLKFSRG